VSIDVGDLFREKADPRAGLSDVCCAAQLDIDREILSASMAQPIYDAARNPA
jgi:hypothetical protein